MQKRKAFTLVELIVIITIIAILGTITFLSFNSYTKEARDAKRLTDISSILQKINVKSIEGYSYSDFILNTFSHEILINGKKELSNQGITNFLLLGENQKNFQDPKNKHDYPIAYSKGLTDPYSGLIQNVSHGKEKYNFIEAATISESNNSAIIRGNYYRIKLGDSPSLFVRRYIDGEDKVIVPDGPILPYDPDEGNTEEEKNYSCKWKGIKLTNVIITNTDNLTKDTEYQNTNSEGKCYYECKPGYFGDDCNDLLTEESSCLGIENLGTDIIKISSKDTFTKTYDLESGKMLPETKIWTEERLLGDGETECVFKCTNDKYAWNPSTKKCDITKERVFGYTGNYEEYIVALSGIYRIELWGAKGGDIKLFNGGKGAYTKGDIYLEKGDKYYIYVGGKPIIGGESWKGAKNGGYNGGGNLTDGEEVFGSAGGGSTDIRIKSGNWDDSISLNSRIMVAGGGGGANDRNVPYDNCPSTFPDPECPPNIYAYGEGDGGGGGKLSGLNGVSQNYFISGKNTWGFSIGKGGKQTTGGGLLYGESYDSLQEIDYESDYFGSGGGSQKGLFTQSGGGSGYYGGGQAGHGGGGGGSSFISGYPGCDAIRGENDRTHTGKPNHYSGLIFTNPIMKGGNEQMPNPQGGEDIIGNTGNGFARIVLVK